MSPFLYQRELYYNPGVFVAAGIAGYFEDFYELRSIKERKSIRIFTYMDPVAYQLRVFFAGNRRNVPHPKGVGHTLNQHKF